MAQLGATLRADHGHPSWSPASMQEAVMGPHEQTLPVDTHAQQEQHGGRHAGAVSTKLRERLGHAGAVSRKLREWLENVAARLFFPISTIVALGAFMKLSGLLSNPGDWPAGDVFKVVAFTIFAALPTWLYVRFLKVKLRAVYVDYVLNLHRLLPDHPSHLPRPPCSSEYFAAWEQGQADEQFRSAGPSPRSLDSRAPSPVPTSAENIYDVKFEAYFGKRPLMSDDSSGGAAASDDAPPPGLGSLLPIFAVWVALTTGWLAILLDNRFLTMSFTGAVTLQDALRFCFLGAYLFTLQLIVRAYFQNDLRSGTYVAVLERLAVSLILVSAIHALWALVADPGALAVVELGVAFVIGSFPLIGQQWLNQVVGNKIRISLPTMYSRHDLGDIDGLDVWYQARLIEEGIGNVQNLATSNLVDVILHSRAPVGRLVDWVDQALLLQHLPPWNQAAGKRRDKEQGRGQEDAIMSALHSLGVRTATDLLELYSPLAVQRAGRHQVHPWWPEFAGEEKDFTGFLKNLPPATEIPLGKRMLALVRTLSDEPNLTLVLNWQCGMKDYRRGRRVQHEARPSDAFELGA